MKKQLEIIFLFMLFILLPRTAEACMGCVQSVMAVKFPFLGSLVIIFLFWVVVSPFIDRPVPKGIKRFLYFGIPVVIFSVVTMAPLDFPVVICWIFYLLVRVLEFLTNKEERLRKNLIPFGVNAITLSVAFIFIAITTTQANSTPGLINSLGKVGPHSTNTIHRQVSRLAKRGPEVVPALSAALKQDFDRDYVSQYRTAQIAYCLRQIGGTQAEAALKELVEQRVTFKDRSNSRWETTVCFLYAECAQERAVPVLMGLLNSADGEQADYQKLVAFLALIRTQDLSAVETVLNHATFLQELHNLKHLVRWNADMVSVTLQALAEGETPADLSASPVYEPLRLGLRPDSRTKTGIQWDHRWQKEIDPEALKAKWSQILN